MAILLAMSLLAGSAGLIRHEALAGKPDADARRAESKPADSDRESPDSVTFSGWVRDVDGKPVASARVRLWDSNPCAMRARVRATTGADGRYRFTVRKAEFARRVAPDFPEPWKYTAVVALADRYGFGSPLLVDGRLPPIEATTIQVVKDVPVTGRVIGLEGKPIAGVTVRVRGIQWPVKRESGLETHDLGAFIQALKTRKEGYYPQGELLSGIRDCDRGRDLDDLYPPVRTDAAGRFSITGIGRERVADLLIEGATIETKYVYALTRRCETIEVPARKKGNPPSGLRQPLYTHYGAAFEHVAAPSKPIVGIVRDKDTGRPIAGVVVTSYMLADLLVDERLPFRAVTDQGGRYRITGMPRGKGNTLQASAPAGAAAWPYRTATGVADETPGLEPITVNFALQRGETRAKPKDD
jgi:hypothetical protein